MPEIVAARAEVIDSADGVWLYTRAGRRILDFAGGAAGFAHGHNHPRIVAARLAFAEQRRMEVHKTYFSPYVAALGHNLAQLLPADLDVSFFPNSGAEAIEGAVKLAYKYHRGRRHTVLRSDVAAHGRLLGSGSLSAGEPDRFPGIPGVVGYRYDDLDSVREAVSRHRGDVYALLVEPFSVPALRGCSERFLRGVRELCASERIVLIFDEVRTGLGRTGSLFHFLRHPGLVPDVMVTGRSFGGGKSSISAFVARRRFFRRAYDNLVDSLMHSTSTTYYGFGEENVTAIEAIAVAVEEDYPRRARDIEAVLRPGLAGVRAAFADVIDDVRGAGATFGVEFAGGAPVARAVANRLYRDHGIRVGAGRPLPVAPQLVAEPEHVRRFLDAFAAAVEAVSRP